MDIKGLVESSFGVGHIMVKIAECESNFRQFDNNGNVLRGEKNTKDVGIYQINETYHLTSSQKSGLDIYSTNGNIEYAKRLYTSQGTKPWDWSQRCWSQ